MSRPNSLAGLTHQAMPAFVLRAGRVDHKPISSAFSCFVGVAKRHEKLFRNVPFLTSPDGSLLSFVGFLDGVPQVMVMAATGGEPWAITTYKEGVTKYEWSPDGSQIAFLASDPTPPEEEQRKKEKSYVIEVDRNQRLPRVWVQSVRGGTPKAISPPDQSVVDFGWAPDGRTLA